VLSIESNTVVWNIVPEEVLPVWISEDSHCLVDVVDISQEAGDHQLVAEPHCLFETAKPLLLIITNGKDNLGVRIQLKTLFGKDICRLARNGPIVSPKRLKLFDLRRVAIFVLSTEKFGAE
jgi:hypothetical protein